MRQRDEERRDPFATLGDEPVTDLTSGVVPGLQRRPKAGGRKKPIRPAERRRRARMFTVTFSDPEIIARLRALAERWEMFAPGGGPNVSAVVEYLLLPQLERAEAGKIEGPEE